MKTVDQSCLVYTSSSQGLAQSSLLCFKVIYLKQTASYNQSPYNLGGIGKMINIPSLDSNPTLSCLSIHKMETTLLIFADVWSIKCLSDFIYKIDSPLIKCMKCRTRVFLPLMSHWLIQIERSLPIWTLSHRGLDFQRRIFHFQNFYLHFTRYD